MSQKAITIDLGDGIPREVCFTIGSLARFHKATGTNPFHGDFWANISPEGLIGLLRAGLNNTDLDALVDSLPVHLVPDIFRKVMDACLGRSDTEVSAGADPSKSSGPSAA